MAHQQYEDEDDDWDTTQQDGEWEEARQDGEKTQCFITRGGGGGGVELLPPGLISSGNYTAYKHITSSLLHHYDVICTGDDTQRTDSREQRSTSPSQRSASFGRAGTVRKNINRSVKIVNRSVGQHHLLNT